MNILLIIPETSGTIAGVSHNLYLAIKKHVNANVYVACLGAAKNGYDFGEIYLWKEKSKIPFVGYYINQLSKVAFLKKIKKELKIDVAISTLLGCSALNTLSSVGEKTIGIFHAPLAQTKVLGLKSYLSCWYSYKTNIKKLTKIFAVSKTVKDDLEQITGRDAEILYNIHNFERISSLSKEELQDEEYKLFNNCNIVLYVGNMYSVKAPDRLIMAFEKYKETTRSTAKLVFIGPVLEKYEKDFDNIIKSVNIEIRKDVHFLGKKENPYKYMSRSSILVSPSRSEGLPGVIIEALSLGIPIVTTNSTIGVWEIMECENEYNQDLKGIKITDYGIITPNVLEDENFTIDQLALGIKNALNSKFDNISLFNKERFRAENIVRQLFK